MYDVSVQSPHLRLYHNTQQHIICKMITKGPLTIYYFIVNCSLQPAVKALKGETTRLWIFPTYFLSTGHIKSI